MLVGVTAWELRHPPSLKLPSSEPIAETTADRKHAPLFPLQGGGGGKVVETDEHGTSNFQSAAKEKDQGEGGAQKHVFLRNEPDSSRCIFRCKTLCR